MNAKTILRAFYSRGRKAFLPLLTTEVARRAKITEETARLELLRLSRMGAAVSRQTEMRIFEWELTDAGKRAARTVMQAEEVGRSS